MSDTGTNPKPSPQVRWNNANPKALWAHSALRSAIRKGLIKRGPCAICGATENVDGHHDDYDRPMDVTWLCRLHHRAEHRNLQLAQNEPVEEPSGRQVRHG